MRALKGDHRGLAGAAVAAFGGAGYVFGDRTFDHSGVCPDPASGQKRVEYVAADRADQVDDGVGDDTGRGDELVTSGVAGDGETPVVGFDIGPVRGGVTDRDPQHLVGDQ